MEDQMVSWDGRKMQTGIVTAGNAPSEYSFGMVEKVTIEVALGACRINGSIIDKGQHIVIEAGEKFTIEPLGPKGSSTVLTWLYGDVERMEPDVLVNALRAAE